MLEHLRNTFIFADAKAGNKNIKRIINVNKTTANDLYAVSNNGKVKPALIPTGYGGGLLFMTPGTVVRDQYKPNPSLVDQATVGLEWVEDAMSFKHRHLEIHPNYMEGHTEDGYDTYISDPAHMFRKEHLLDFYPSEDGAPFQAMEMTLVHRDRVDDICLVGMVLLKYLESPNFVVYNRESEEEIITDGLEMIVTSTGPHNTKDRVCHIIFDKPEDIDAVFAKYAPNLKVKRMSLFDELSKLSIPNGYGHAFNSTRKALNIFAGKNTEYDVVYFVEGTSQDNLTDEEKDLHIYPEALINTIMYKYRKDILADAVGWMGHEEWKEHYPKAMEHWKNVKHSYMGSIVVNMTRLLPEIAEYCAVDYGDKV